MAVTCWGGGDTLSLTKEINFPVPWPSRKAALKREGTALSITFLCRTDYGTTEKAITPFVHFSWIAEPYTRGVGGWERKWEASDVLK